MFCHIVMTSGISLFDANNFFGKRTREATFFNFPGKNPVLPPDEDENQRIDTWLGAMKTALQTMTDEDIRHISAEYSMLNALKCSDQLNNNPTVTLLHTDTLGGRATTRLLKYLFNEHFNAKVNLKELVGLNVSDRVQLNRALGEYMKKLSDALISGDTYGTCFAPIGGYKVMTSFGYIVGSYHGFPTAYLHEDAQTLLIIPPVPIDIDTDFLTSHADLLRRLMLEDLLQIQDLGQNEQSLIRDYPAFFALEEDYALLNPFGHFIFSQDKYAGILGKKFYFSDEVMKMIERDEARQQFIRQQLREMVNKLANPGAHWGELYHEETFHTLKGENLQWHLYKGASNGNQGVFRAAWRYEQQGDTLYINRIWLDHELYEKEVTRSQGLTKDGYFQDMTAMMYKNQIKVR